MKKLFFRTFFVYLNLLPLVSQSVPMQCQCSWSSSGQCPDYKVLYWIDDVKTCCYNNKLPGWPVMPLRRACQGTWQPVAIDESEYKTRCDMGCIARQNMENQLTDQL